MGYLLDMAILTAIIAAGYLGWRVGGTRSLATVSGAVAGGFLAWQEYQYVAARLSWLISSREAGEIVSFVAIALGVFITVVLLGIMARRLAHVLFLGWLDSALGGVVGTGLALGLVFSAVVTLDSLPGADTNGVLGQSNVVQFIVDGGLPLTNLFPEPVSGYLESTLMQPRLPWQT